jgi:DNA helicase HerA-like ATPase
MHVLIVGTTQSGKTTLAREFAHKFARKGHRIIVYDPVGTPSANGVWPMSAKIFDREMPFISYMIQPDVRHAHVFVDESNDIFSLQKDYNHWMLTRGRHFGLTIYVITQRPKMVAPNVRGQCGRAYIFHLGNDDLKQLAGDFGVDAIKNEVLDKGDFIVLESGTTQYTRSNIFKLLKTTPKEIRK